MLDVDVIEGRQIDVGRGGAIVVRMHVRKTYVLAHVYALLVAEAAPVGGEQL